MMRPIISYVLTSVILLSQTGLPVHTHYCKGMLETVSVFFNLGCSDHAEKKADACCKADLKTTQSSHQGCCSATTSSCCDDEVAVLFHEFTSLLPHFEKWNADAFTIQYSFVEFGIENIQSVTPPILSFTSEGGPPLYILNGSLIFYS